MTPVLASRVASVARRHPRRLLVLTLILAAAAHTAMQHRSSSTQLSVAGFCATTTDCAAGERCLAGACVTRLAHANRNYSAGRAPHYATNMSGWARLALLRAGLSDGILNATAVVELEPSSPGIPRATKTTEFAQFKRTLKDSERAILRARAAGLAPPMPWLVLALYHRGMLGGGPGGGQFPEALRAVIRKEGWASARLSDHVGADGMTITERFDALRAFGLDEDAVVVDAGCGWGRLGKLLIQYLRPECYFGIELDEFELRAFIQLELALENAALALEKRPTLLQSGAFQFGLLLGGSRRADMVVFSSVLKDAMPRALRKAALCRAARVLKANASVVIFQNCGAATEDIAKEVGAAFAPLAQFQQGAAIAQASMCYLRRTEEMAPNASECDGHGDGSLDENEDEEKGSEERGVNKWERWTGSH
jgi:hypothetical protein